MNEVKYRECRIKAERFTVKLIYKPTGGIYYNPIVKVRVMKWHEKPTTLLDKLLEVLRFSIDCYEWDPLLIDCSLEDYCREKCLKHVNRQETMNKAEIEWGRI